jgi:hypothetical protein
VACLEDASAPTENMPNIVYGVVLCTVFIMKCDMAVRRQ